MEEADYTLGRSKTLIYGALGLVLVGLVAFSVCELAVRIFDPQDLSGTWLVPSGRGHLINKASGTSRHQLGDRRVEYRFGEFHTRGGPVGEGKRVLVLGDSFSFGWLLDEQATYVSLIAGYADREFGEDAFEFINAATGGWGTEDYLAFLEEWGPKIEPDVVLVFFGYDDIHRSLNSGLYGLADARTLKLEAHDVPVRRIKQFANALPGYQFLLEHSHLVQLTRNNIVTRAPTGPRGHVGSRKDRLPVHPDTLALGRALLRSLRGWCEDYDARLLIVTEGYQVWYDERTSGSDRLFYAHAEKIFATEGIPYHDIAPAIAAVAPGPDDYVVADGVHPNEAGSRLIADETWKWLSLQLRALDRASR